MTSIHAIIMKDAITYFICLTMLICWHHENSYYRYTWTKNDEPLAISGIDIRQLPGQGTIVIEDPHSPEHEGIYQCFANNELGTAISVKTMLKKAGQLIRCLSCQLKERYLTRLGRSLGNKASQFLFSYMECYLQRRTVRLRDLLLILIFLK